MNHDDLLNRFTYHPPNDKQRWRYETLRSAALALAELFEDLGVPDSREKSLALTHLEETVMWANAAIARNA